MEIAKGTARKLLAVVLTAALALSMVAASAFADEDSNNTTAKGTITVDSAAKDQTYTIYEILKLESYDVNAGAYSYKATTDWSKFINSDTIKDVYVDVDAQGYVTWIKDANAADFAKAAQKYAADNKISNQGTKTATGTTVTFDNLELGYYLLDSSLGTLCSLDTTNSSVTIKEKNTVPTNEEAVEEDSTGKYGDVNDADIGQTVKFKSAATLPKGSENVTFHDTMSNGLTLDTTSIKVYTNENLTAELAAGNYTVITTGLTDGCTFEVEFTQTYLDGLTDETTVYVGYSATLNSNAVVGGNGNPNTSKVEYGEKGETTFTPNSTTTTYTWSFDVLKYANGNESKVLEGVEFVLLNNDRTKVATIADGKLTSWMDVPTAGADGSISWPGNTTLTTDKQGKINIAGLDADTYYLRETKALDGYNILNTDAEVKIQPTADSKDKTLTLTPVTAKVENKSGSELPSTGGMGTTLLYVVGGILVVGAGVGLVVRRRMGSGR